MLKLRDVLRQAALVPAQACPLLLKLLEDPLIADDLAGEDPRAGFGLTTTGAEFSGPAGQAEGPVLDALDLSLGADPLRRRLELALEPRLFPSYPGFKVSSRHPQRVKIGLQDPEALGESAQPLLIDSGPSSQVLGFASPIFPLLAQSPQLNPESFLFCACRLLRTDGSGQGVHPRFQLCRGRSRILLRLRERVHLSVPVKAVPTAESLAERRRKLALRLRSAGLKLQAPQPGRNLAKYVAHPLKIRLGLLEIPDRLVALGLIDADTRRLLEELPPLLGTHGEGHVHQPLTDYGVGVGAQARLGEELHNVLAPHQASVEKVLVLTGAVGASSYGNLFELDVQPVRAVVEDEGGFGHANSRPSPGPREDQILTLAGAEGLQTLLSENPADGVGDVALPRSVGSDDAGDPLLELEGGSTGEGLEPLQLQPL